MTAEIERKFLVVNDSWQDHASKGAAFCQGYLLVRKNRFVRVRIIDNARGVLTIKPEPGACGARSSNMRFPMPKPWK